MRAFSGLMNLEGAAMMSQYLPYVVTEAFCAVYAVSVLFRLNRSIGTEHEVRQLRNMIYTYLIMLLTDTLYTLSDSDVLRMNRWITLTVDAVLVLSITAGCYFWYRFIEDRLHRAHPVVKRTLALTQIPMFAICALDALSIFTGWLFMLDEYGHYQSTRLFDIQSVVNYFYLVIPTVACAYRAIRTHSKSEREEYATYAAYMVAPMIGGLLEGVFPLVPVLPLSIFMIIHILFLMIQNLQIYNDALTDLNNRRRLNQFLENRLPKASAEHPLKLFMLDLNGFKSINDTYGHLEGDNALQTFAGVLRAAAARYSAFIARYGGDEFCLVTEAPGRAPEQIVAELQELLRSAQRPEAKYTLTVSAGYVVCDKPESQPDAVLRRADEMLYASKREWHRLQAQTS